MTGRNPSAPAPICAGLPIERRAHDILLVGKRAAERAFYPGVWDLKGEHVAAGETPEETLVRETREEIGVTALAWREAREARVVDLGKVRRDGGRAEVRLAGLDEVRAEIDRIDEALIGLLAKRAAYVRRAGELRRTEADRGGGACSGSGGDGDRGVHRSGDRRDTGTWEVSCLSRGACPL